MEDVIIVGGGIIGCLVAYYCSRYQCNVLVLEKGNDVANEQTLRNCSVLHLEENRSQGTYLSAKGLRMAEQLCRDLKVDYQKIDSLLVACNDEEVCALKEMFQQHQNQFRWLDKAACLARNPHFSEQVQAALLSEERAIIEPWKVAIAAMEEAMGNGIKLACNQEVVDIEKRDGFFYVRTKDHEYRSRMVINCAGNQAYEISKMVIGEPDFSFELVQEQYAYLLPHFDVGRLDMIQRVNHRLQVVPTIRGGLMIGPLDQDSKQELLLLLKRWDWAELHFCFTARQARSTRPYILEQSVVEDFIQVAGFYKSGITCACAIASELVEELIQERFHFMKQNVMCHRQKNVVLSRCDVEQRQRYVVNNPRYGNIVCECGMVSEQEIIDCIKRKCGARSIMGVMKRVNAGCGLCRGADCHVKLIQILSEVLQLDFDEVAFDQEKGAIHERG